MSERPRRLNTALLSWMPVFFVAMASFLIARILLSPMEWGVMDDVSFIRDFEARYETLTFWGYLRGFLEGEWIWGLYRPVYGAWNYLAYGSLAVGMNLPPFFIYGLNAVLIFLSLFLFSVGFSYFFQAEDRNRAQALFLLGCLFFTPSLNLVSLLSLQEKFPILGASLALLLLNKNKKTEDVLAFLVFWMGPLAKSSAIVFGLPLIYFILKVRPRVRPKWDQGLVAFFVVSIVGWAIFAKWVASIGHYTRRYHWSPEVFPRFFTIGGAWAIAVAIFILGTAWAIYKNKEKDFRLNGATWILTLLGWIAIMLPWGILGYYWSVATPLFAACFSIFFLEALKTLEFKRKVFQIFSTLLLFAVVGVSVYRFHDRSVRLVERSVSTGTVAKWLGSQEAAGFSESWMAFPCSEAARSIAMLSGRESDIKPWRPDFTLKPRSLFITWWECPEIPKGSENRMSVFKDFGAWKVYRYE